MPKRIRLTFNRNQDSETQYYRVFRDEQPNIDHKNSLDRIVMKIEHPRSANPITVEKETLRRESERTYGLAHGKVLLELNGTEFPFNVFVDTVERFDFTLDTDEGKVVFDEPVDMSAVVFVPEYVIDGIQVWDYEIEEAAKTYYGPEAKDTMPPMIPDNVTIEKDSEHNRLILRWDAASPLGKLYYYRIDAAMDEQRYSKLGILRNVFIREPLADRPYTVERSDDGKRWVEIARLKTNIFYEYMIDRQAASPITGLKTQSFMYQNSGKAQVTLTWDKVRDDTFSRTSMYRVRVQNRVGITSDPSSIVGPIPFKVELDHILIRRKTYDGSFPSYDGVDAETVATLTNMSQTQFVEDVPDNTLYVYGMWVVDKGGNYSALTAATIFIGDATAPITPINLSIGEFQVVAG